MLVDEIAVRLEENIATLAHRVHGALQLAELVKNDHLPEATPAAFVVPLGLRGDKASAAAGSYTQNIAATIAVVLVFESADDPTGDRARPRLDVMIDDVLNALAGWSPGNEVGVLEFQKSDLVSMSAGSVIHQINFTINDQLRINS